MGSLRGYRGRRLNPLLNGRAPDMSQKVALGAWHPKENTFAVAKHNSLFVYTELPRKEGSTSAWSSF